MSALLEDATCHLQLATPYPPNSLDQKPRLGGGWSA